MANEQNGEGGRSVSETVLDISRNPVDGGIIVENWNRRGLFRKGEAHSFDDLEGRERERCLSSEGGQNGLRGMDVDHRARLREECVENPVNGCFGRRLSVSPVEGRSLPVKFENIFPPDSPLVRPAGSDEDSPRASEGEIPSGSFHPAFSVKMSGKAGKGDLLLGHGHRSLRLF